MKVRFRKRIKLAPGVHINIGKKGVSSATLGPRGESINVNAQGAKQTVSVPGAGISFTNDFASAENAAAASRATDTVGIGFGFRIAFIVFVALFVIAALSKS